MFEEEDKSLRWHSRSRFRGLQYEKSGNVTLEMKISSSL